MLQGSRGDLSKGVAARDVTIIDGAYYSGATATAVENMAKICCIRT
jgi:hypothetical protein